MTREEKLHWLNVEIQTWENDCQSKHPIKEALYAARKELEQEPCEDAVSRKSVIAIIQNHWWNCRDIDKLVNELPPVTPQELRWIPVTEKRPVEFEKVLVTYRLHYDNSIHVGIGNIIASDVNERYYWNINEQDYVGWDMLAWMPLPEPYKGRD